MTRRYDEHMAYHEAGHAVAAYLIGYPFTLILLKRRKLAQLGWDADGRVFLDEATIYGGSYDDEVDAAKEAAGAEHISQRKACGLLRLMRRDLNFHMAGLIAEDIKFGGTFKQFWGWTFSGAYVYGDGANIHDWLKDWAFICADYCHQEREMRVMAYLEYKRVKAFLREAWPAVEALAAVLVKKGELTGDEATQIIREALAQPAALSK